MFLFDALNSVAPVIGYISQLNLIKKQKSIGSFSINVCAIILISSIMRIFFWFAKGFSLDLLFQSIFLIIVMLILLYECLKYMSVGQKQSFWKWNKFDSYSKQFILQNLFIQQYVVKFLLTFASILTVITLICLTLQFQPYGQFIGFLSLSIQAMLGFPQMISNQKNHSVEGLSYTMIFSWVAGDAFKTFYFIYKDQPFQFIMCGSVQLLVDFIIIGQIYTFSKDKKYQSFIKVQTKENQQSKIKK